MLCNKPCEFWTAPNLTINAWISVVMSYFQVGYGLGIVTCKLNESNGDLNHLITIMEEGRRKKWEK